METTHTPEISSQQKQFALDHLNRTRSEFLAAIANLTDEQWRFKPETGCWSIAENGEHAATVEMRVAANLDRLPDGALADSRRNHEEIDQVVCRQVADRTSKRQAPEVIHPLGTWTLSECISRFEDGRERLLQKLNEGEHLRGRVLPHPVLGLCDGLQWILAASGHTARHTAQILEIKADPNFPGT